MTPETQSAFQPSDLPRRFPVLTLQASAVSLQDAACLILEWAKAEESRSVCAANVHMVMEAYDDPAFADVVNRADLVVPDGMPLAWHLRWQGVRNQQRVCGPDLMLETCRLAAEQNIPIGLYGSRNAVLGALQSQLLACFPKLQITYAFSPPFRPLSADEEATVLGAIQASEARILFVGIGCPRQERWIDQHRKSLSAILLGVGAAFDFHAGAIPVAPDWMKGCGLEWLFRLVVEPRRLWKRYLKHNSRFVVLALWQFVRNIIHIISRDHKPNATQPPKPSN